MPNAIDVKDAAGSTVSVATLDALLTRIGEVQASPTANTTLDRLKALATLLAGGLPAALSANGGVKTGLVDALDATNDAVRNEVVVGQVRKNDGTALTVKRGRATITATTATQIVAAVVSKQIFVLGYSIQSQGSNTPSINFQDDTGTPVVLSRTWKLDATGAAGVNGIQAPPSPMGCGVDPTSSGKALMGKMDATGSVVVEVTYVEL